MGIGGIWQWVVVLAIVLLLFGTKKLRNLGTDLGQAVKGFRKGVQTEKTDGADKDEVATATEQSTTETESSIK